jgi:malonyl-CoA O-methyltransferase
LRRRFDRAASGYDDAAKLDAEIGARMLERLDYVRVAPARVLDAGSGTGRDARALARRYPQAAVIALDHSIGMLRQALASRSLLERLLERLRGRAARAVCGDVARLPLAAGSLDLVWSNLALHWLEDPQPALREFARVLRPEGLLMFSTFGPDTFLELGDARAHKFVDMHDLGDMLANCGFAHPVMDMERLTLSYHDATAFVADLRATAQAPLAVRRGRIVTLPAELDALRSAQRLSITFEIVYGHAWKAAQGRTAEGHALVSAAILKRTPR